jgi:hypothetical protein
MTTTSPAAVAWRIPLAASLTASGYIHAQLYVRGYRSIPDIGTLFLLQASVSLAIAALLLVGAPALLRVAAAGAALGALAGFVGSRTVGVFGFTERGFQPAPQAMLSVLAEVATLLLLLGPLWYRLRGRRTAEAGTSTGFTMSA